MPFMPILMMWGIPHAMTYEAAVEAYRPSKNSDQEIAKWGGFLGIFIKKIS